MGRGIWSILILGVLTALILSLFMLFTLDQYSASPAGNRFKVAELIRGQYKFDSCGADVAPIDGRMILRITYMTKKDSKLDPDVQKAEMAEVAEFAGKKYDGKDRDSIAEIRIQRTELRGRGCFQKAYTNHHTAAAPSEWKAKSKLPAFLQERQNP